ncbi:MAG: cytochrome c oxidase subunit 2 [Planctomycetota bacterium]|jgi:cytochrome c oxidase subunit 2
MPTLMMKLSSVYAGLASRMWVTGLTVMILAGLSHAQEVEKRWAPLEPASDYGYRFGELFWLITILCTVSMTIVMILLCVPFFRDRARPGHKASYDHGSSLHDKRLTAVISVVTFVILDAWVLVIAMKDLREAYWKIPELDEPGLYQVEVLGQQWAWNFRATGIDGVFGTADDILEMNHLTVPKGRPVSLQMTSKDVIHALFLPEMRMKRDVNPGAINEMWFRAIKSGEFTILCAELCGYAHYQMHGHLTVLEQDQFDNWEQEASQLAETAFDSTDNEAQWAWSWE